jgi:general nucleoside transport system ATP-binding protein
VIATDAGSVRVFGRELTPATPTEAIRRGVAMVHQHFMLVDALNGLENLALGTEQTRFGLLDLDSLETRIARVARDLKLEVALRVPVAELSIGERQRLELLRALVHTPKVLILDEPTAVLAPREADAVLALARELASRGMAIALVTHHLDEVARFADEVTVLRRGAVVAHHEDDAVRDVKRLAREAVGEEPERIKRTSRTAGELAIKLDTLSVRSGEIVGVAGVEGNGQHALEQALVASIPRDEVSWIPSDRHAHGISELPARDVVRLGAWPTSGRLVDEQALDGAFAEAVAAYEIRPNDGALLATSYSGGNQQKLVVARELRRTPRLLVAAHPTRGVDVRAAATIRRAILDAAEAGAAVVVISSDLDELRTMSDRIVVLRKGAIVRELAPDATIAEIGDAMLGDA